MVFIQLQRPVGVFQALARPVGLQFVKRHLRPGVRRTGIDAQRCVELHPRKVIPADGKEFRGRLREVTGAVYRRVIIKFFLERAEILKRPPLGRGVPENDAGVVEINQRPVLACGQVLQQGLELARVAAEQHRVEMKQVVEPTPVGRVLPGLEQIQETLLGIVRGDPRRFVRGEIIVRGHREIKPDLGFPRFQSPDRENGSRDIRIRGCLVGTRARRGRRAAAATAQSTRAAIILSGGGPI